MAAPVASCSGFDDAIHAAEVALREGARLEQQFTRRQETEEACSRAAWELRGFESLQVTRRASDPAVKRKELC